MPISAAFRAARATGVTLIELLVFIVAVAVALAGLLAVFYRALDNSVDPLMHTRGLELAQAKLDEVMARKFAENTPTGAVPACGSFDAGGACTAIQGVAVDPARDDVGDYHGEISDDSGYRVAVAVVEAGGDFIAARAVPADQARRITVTVTMPDASTLQLSSYKVNF